jgi:arylsulfatase
MEVFAGFAEHIDHEVGRLVQALEDSQVLDNTLLAYIAGDNGASAEGGLAGMFNEMSFFNGVPETVADQLKHLDQWGGPETFPHYAAGWAGAGDTPFAWTKQIASDYGGTKNGMVVHWPRGIKAKGELQSQWHHVVDLAPTILEVSGLPFPQSVNGTPQKPFEGVSMAYTFNDPQAKERHATQYFEIAGNRALYHDGWLARTVHKFPWAPQPRAPLDKDLWELFDTRTDYSLADDLASKEPARLRDLQVLFLKEAVKYNILPIDDRSLERLDPRQAGRPDLLLGRTSLTLYEGMTGMMENAFIDVKNRSHTITAEVEIPRGGANGVILAQAGRFGGWSLYLSGGKLAYTYNWIGRERYKVAAAQPLAAGKAMIRVDFAYDGGGRGKGATARLSVNGNQVAEGRIERTNANLFSADEGADVGQDEGTPVTEDYKEGAHNNKFSGKIKKITIDLK